MNCLFCGVKLVGRRQKKYCSVQCSRAHRHELAKKKLGTNICEMCGKEFDVHRPSGRANRGEVKEGRFCSKKCYFVWVKQQPKKVKPERKWACVVCGKEMTSYAVYCGDECRKEKERQRYHRNAGVICLKRREAYKPKDKKDRICGMCGTGFTSAHGSSLYCSKECRKQAGAVCKNARKRAKKNGVYYEHVNPIKVFKRDGWRCQLCGKKLNMKHRGTIRDDAPELDHIIPWAKGGEHSYRNTQCTCRKCNAEKGAREFGQLRLFG